MRTFFDTLLAVLALAVTPAQAVPVSVWLHPNGALVQEEINLSADKDHKTLRVMLPPSADPQSLDLSVPGHAVTALRFEDAIAPDSAVVADLREKLNAVDSALQALETSQADEAARREYWRHPPVQLSDGGGLADLDRQMREQLTQFQQPDAGQTQKRNTLRAEADLLRQQLERAGGNAPNSPNAPLTHEAVVELAAPVSAPVTVRYTYALESAGWRPLYRVEALPATDKVRITLEAELWQRSGDNWADVPLVLSTADPRQGMAPPRMPDWIIRPQPAPRVMPRNGNEMMLGAAPMPMTARTADMAEFNPASGARPPVYADGATFESWDLGRCTVPAGPSLRLPLSNDTLKANFAYILRPSRTETAFLSAKLDLPELRHMPAGDALFLVDGVTVGKAPFSLANDESRIYFGRDPLVSAVMKKGNQQSGKQGIIDREQTYIWDWTITVFNKHDRPIAARVEEPAPESRDEQIVLNVVSRPEAKTEDQALVWNVTVPAGKSASIRHTVNFTAPTDMTVWEGR